MTFMLKPPTKHFSLSRARQALLGRNVVRFAQGHEEHENTLRKFASVEEAVRVLQPSEPLHCMTPHEIRASAKAFLEGFGGDSYYAIKSNPDPYVLKTLYQAGICHFDVASLREVALIHELFPSAKMAFMNPVKGREAIRTAYFRYGVRVFVLDARDELNKIVEETDGARDLTLVVRVAMPKGSAACALTGKFGATPEDSVGLLLEAQKFAARLGLSFHVGSQTLDPSSYVDAIRKAGEILAQAEVTLGVLDIGGGFPAIEMGQDVPPLPAFFDAIKKEISHLALPQTCEIWAEPGRALSARASKLVARVELRKGNALYLNDGSYGSLFEVCAMKWQNKVSLVPSGNRDPSDKLIPFSFWGPTCDSIDKMEGPFMLPEDVREGDWIVFETMGAYGTASTTRFNGFCSQDRVEILEDQTR